MAKPQLKLVRKLITGGDPEQLYPIPAPEEFEKAGSEYLDADDLETIGEALIVLAVTVLYIVGDLIWERLARRILGQTLLSFTSALKRAKG